MNLLWISTLTALGLGTVALVVLLARLLRYRQAFAGEAGDFSMERYEPMMRLLDPADFAFLARQPGAAESGALEKMKRDRRRIFRTYLWELAADFREMHAQARELVAAAPEQHADLVGILLRQQVSFWAALGMIELELALDRMGLAAVNPQRLVAAAGSLRAALDRATAVPGPVPV